LVIFDFVNLAVFIDEPEVAEMVYVGERHIVEDGHSRTSPARLRSSGNKADPSSIDSLTLQRVNFGP